MPRFTFQHRSAMHAGRVSVNDMPPLWMVTQVNDRLDPVSAASRVMAFAQDMLRCSKEVSV